MTRRRWAIPYLLLAPGILWLVLFFVLPSVQMFVMSLSTQAGGSGLTRHYEFSWAWQNYVNAITDFPEQFANSLVFGGMATLLCLLIGYPLAYGIAFRGGRYKTFLLVPRDRPVLHELPHPDDLVEDHPRQRRGVPVDHP